MAAVCEEGGRGLMVVAIVGRPNVGKSTLFNRLIGRRVAIVVDEPGATRDRNYAKVSFRDKTFTVVDTGGLLPHSRAGLLPAIRAQAERAVAEAGAVILVMDAREGINPIDQEIAEILRKSGKPIFLAVNKSEGKKGKEGIAEFYRLGLGEPFPISVLHGIGVDDLLEAIYPLIPAEEGEPEAPEEIAIPKIVVLGRPNVGKSTLINSILGDERLIVSPVPGTTRDPVDTEVSFGSRRYLYIDTAGIRRRGKIVPGVERFSVARALEVIWRADIVLLVIDAGEGITEQETKIAGEAIRVGRGIILLINKWDLERGRPREPWLSEVSRRFPFLSYAPVHFISALKGEGLRQIFNLIDHVYAAYTRRVPTGELNRFFEKILEEQPPPRHRGRPARIYYVTQAGTKPPTFVLFTGPARAIPDNYLGYIENSLRERFGFLGTPLRIRVRPKTS